LPEDKAHAEEAGAGHAVDAPPQREEGEGPGDAADGESRQADLQAAEAEHQPAHCP